MKTDSEQSGEDVADDCLSVGIFAALEPVVRRRFGRLGVVEVLPPGAFVTKQGAAQDRMAVILDGEVSVSCHAHGDIVHLADIGAGGLVGEMSLMDRLPGSADVVVKGDSARLWRIDYERFDAFLADDPASGLAVYRLIAAELCRLLRCNSESMLHNKDTMRSRFLDMDY